MTGQETENSNDNRQPENHKIQKLYLGNMKQDKHQGIKTHMIKWVDQQ